QGINQVRPQVSASGTQLVFEAERGPFGQKHPIDLQVYDLRSLTVRTLTRGDGQYVQGSWSPDGSKIAYACAEVGAKDLAICVMNADGSNQHVVTRGAGSYEWPAWAPDSQRIAFFVATTENGKTDCVIAVVRSDGTQQTILTKHTKVQRDETPSWSPN